MTLLCDMSKGPLDKKYQSINFLFHLQTKSSMHLNEAGYWMYMASLGCRHATLIVCLQNCSRGISHPRGQPNPLSTLSCAWCQGTCGILMMLIFIWWNLDTGGQMARQIMTCLNVSAISFVLSIPPFSVRAGELQTQYLYSEWFMSFTPM